MSTANSTQQAEKSKTYNTVLWVAVIALTAAAVVGNIYFEEQSVLFRAAALVVVAAVVLGLWLQTAMGVKFRHLYHGARIELRKVVWPTRQETLQSSLVVLAVVAVIALILWLFDSVFAWLISFLVGV